MCHLGLLPLYVDKTIVSASNTAHIFGSSFYNQNIIFSCTVCRGLRALEEQTVSHWANSFLGLLWFQLTLTHSDLNYPACANSLPWHVRVFERTDYSQIHTHTKTGSLINSDAQPLPCFNIRNAEDCADRREVCKGCEADKTVNMERLEFLRAGRWCSIISDWILDKTDRTTTNQGFLF